MNFRFMQTWLCPARQAGQAGGGEQGERLRRRHQVILSFAAAGQTFLSAAIRNPAAADGAFPRLIFGFAVTEALGIFSLLIALLLLFVF